jgi:TolA-binding protein
MNSPNYKELFRETGCLSAEILMRYRDGRLSPDEKHVAEHHLTGCELCSDALEGLSLPHSEKAVADINESIRRRHASGNNTSVKPYFAVAATLTALVLLSWFAWNQFNSVSDERLAVSNVAEEESLPVLSESNPAESVPEKETVVSVPKYEPKPMADPNGNRSIAPAAEIASVQEEVVEDRGVEAASDDAVAISEKEMAPDAVTLSTAPAQSEASGAASSVAIFSNSGQNITYIDNLKVYNYDEQAIADKPAIATKAATRKSSSNNQQKSKMSQAEETYNNNNNRDYNSTVSGPLMLYNQGKYDAAIRGFDRLLQSNPADQNAIYYKAMSNYHLGKFDNAIKLLEPLAADENSPFMEEAMFYLAESYANTGQKVPAYNLYNNIIKNNSYNNQRARDNIKNMR